MIAQNIQISQATVRNEIWFMTIVDVVAADGKESALASEYGWCPIIDYMWVGSLPLTNIAPVSLSKEQYLKNSM